MNKIAIITPTYNEAKNIGILISQIEKVVQEITDYTFALLVVDDNSPDGTAGVAEKAGKKVKAKNFKVEVLNRVKKDGIGKAYVHGIKTAINHGFDYVIQIDADLQHNPKYIKDLVNQARQGKDFVGTSRYMKGGHIVGWGLHRRILSLGGNLYTRLFLGSTITDYTNGLNLFSTKLLKKVDMDNLGASGYGFFIELKYKALKQAKDFTQIPITLIDRQHGESKITKDTLFVNMMLVPRLRFRG